MQSILILGRQPELGLAELESLYGADAITSVGSQAAIVDVDPCLLAFDRLGGAQKFAKVLTTLDTTVWHDIETFLVSVAPGHAETMPEGKMHLGLSLYGFNERIQRIEATGLTLKKAIRKTGRSVRLVPNKETELNTASVLHNKLTTPNGWELLFIKDGSRTVVAQTVKVQDIDAYARRDRERPARDTKVGMLPPKLAQIIINLAAGPLPKEQLQNICDIPAGQPVPRSIINQTLLDPFCGTGVLLQEALLIGYNVYGSDLEPRMIDYSRKNLNWLDDVDASDALLEAGDATNHQWQPAPDLVACETYLGRPFTSRPDKAILEQTVSECSLIIRKFLQNLHGQIKPGTRLCLAVPAWQTAPGQFRHLPLIDKLSDLGYERVSLRHISGEFIYSRSDQVVGRELLILTRQ